MRRAGTRSAVAALALLVTTTGCVGDEADWDAFCADVAVADGAGPVFPDPAAERPRPDPAALAALRAMLDSAPPSVADDVEVLVAAVDAVVAAVATGAGDPSAAPPYDPEALAAARTAVVETARDRCDVDLESPLG